MRNPMRVIPNGDGCDVVFTVRRRPGMSEADLAADVDAVTADRAALRTLMEHSRRAHHRGPCPLSTPYGQMVAGGASVCVVGRGHGAAAVLTSPCENGDRCSGRPTMTGARGSTEAFEAIMSDVDPPSYVVTAADGDDRAGCLVGFATQCSIDPPRFGVWLSKLNRTYRVARTSRTLIVHLLRHDDGDLAGHFGGETGDDVDKFAGIDWSSGPDGCPVIERLDWFAGSVVDQVDSGDHVAFVLSPWGGRRQHPGRQLSESELGDIEPGHPVPGR